MTFNKKKLVNRLEILACILVFVVLASLYVGLAYRTFASLLFIVISLALFTCTVVVGIKIQSEKNKQ